MKKLTIFFFALILACSIGTSNAAQQRLGVPYFIGYTTDGAIVPEGLLYTYDAGTSDAKTTYQDYDLSTPHENPIELDSNGQALVYFTGQMKINLKTSAGVQVSGYPIDYIEGINENYGELEFEIVANFAALGTGSTDGQVKKTADTDVLYSWDSTLESWTPITGTLAVASAAALGTGSFDGQPRVDAGTGNLYTWDNDNSKWRIQSGNIYATNPSASTYTIETGTRIYNTTVKEIYIYKGSAWGFEPPSLPLGYIDGFVMSNPAGAGTYSDIDISAGEARDSTDTYNLALSSTLVKELNASWAEGTTAGGLATGSVTNSTWYHVFLIGKTDGTADAIFDTSTTASNRPSTTWPYYRMIGSIYTDSNTNPPQIKHFDQFGDDFIWDVAMAGASFTTTTTALNETVYTPNGIKCKAYLDVHTERTAAASMYGLIYDPDTTATAPSSTQHNISGHDSKNTVRLEVYTNTSSQVKKDYGTNGVGGQRIITHGFQHPRGKDNR